MVDDSAFIGEIQDQDPLNTPILREEICFLNRRGSAGNVLIFNLPPPLDLGHSGSKFVAPARLNGETQPAAQKSLEYDQAYPSVFSLASWASPFNRIVWI
jgi:hypothetical protein